MNPQIAAELEALSHQLEADRTAVADTVTAISKTLDTFYWLVEGRGSYEWDDDRYRSEFTNAALKLKEQLAPLQKIAADWTGCPKTSREVACARIDIAAELERLRVAAAGFEACLKEIVAMIPIRSTVPQWGPDDIWHASAKARSLALIAATSPGVILAAHDAELNERLRVENARLRDECGKLEGALACSNATAKRRGAERDAAVASEAVLREAMSAMLTPSCRCSLCEIGRSALASEPSAHLEKLKAELRRECADIVRDSMRHYEDEEITGTMRIALKCIADKINGTKERLA